MTYTVVIGERFGLTATNCRHNTNVRGTVQRHIQHFITPDDTAVHKDVHVLADIALFGEYAVAQSSVPIPQLIQRVAHRRWLSVDFEFSVTAGEFGQVTGNLKRDHLEMAIEAQRH